MRRRSVLASTIALLGPGLAGCLGESTAGDSTATTAATTSDPQSSEYSLTVAFERLQPAVVVLTEEGTRVIGDGQQYLFCRVDATGNAEPPDRLAFAFRLGGNTYSPGVESAGQLWRAESWGGRYDAGSGRGWLVFELPEAWRAEHAALSLRGAEWPVGPDIRDRLAATPPALAVDWRVERGASSEEAAFAFEVGNDGEYDSWFVATVTEVSGEGEESLVSVLEEPIPGGETVSWTTTRNVDGGGGEPTFALSWLGGRLTDSR